jgi:hypothetical protein
MQANRITRMPIFFRTFLSSSQNAAKAVPDDWNFETASPFLLQEACQEPAKGGKKAICRKTRRRRLVNAEPAAKNNRGIVRERGGYDRGEKSGRGKIPNFPTFA